MSLFREHRLIHLQIDDLQRQREKAGLSGTVLSSPQRRVQQGTETYSAINPQTGKAETYTRGIATPVAQVADQRQMAEHQEASTPTQSTGFMAPTALTGSPYSSPDQVFDKAKQEYMENGSVSPETTAYLSKLGFTSDDLTFNNTTGVSDSSMDDRIKQLQKYLASPQNTGQLTSEDDVSKTYQRNSSESQQRAAAAAELKSLLDIQKMQPGAIPTASTLPATTPTTPSGTPRGQPGTMTTPAAPQPTVMDAALDAIMAGLPQQYQSLGPALKSLLAQGNQGIAEQVGLAGQSVNAANASYASSAGILNKLATQITGTKNDMKAVLDTVKASQEQALLAEKKAVEDRNTWDVQKRERELRSKQQKDIEGKITELGFKGGFGSGKGIQDIRDAEVQWEQAITDLQMEAGVQRTELAAKFTGMWNKIQEDYASGMASKLKTWKQEMNTLALKGIDITDKRDERVQKANEALVTNVSKIRGDTSKGFMDGVKEMRDIASDERTFNAQEDKWQEQIRQHNEDVQLRREEFTIRLAEKADTALDRADTKERDLSNKKVEAITKLIDQDDAIKLFLQARTVHDTLTTAFADKGNPFRDRAMAKAYEKLIEPNSVVMPGEYTDIAANVPLASKIQGKLARVLSGGLAWTEDEREALKQIGDSLFTSYQRHYNESSQKFMSQMEYHNSTITNPSYHLSPSFFGLPESMTSNQRSGLEGMALPGLFPTGPATPGGGGDADSIGHDLLSFGRLTQGFDTAIDTSIYPASVVKAWKGQHRGIDIAMPEGTRVPSFVSGRVIQQGWDGGWGRTLIIMDAKGAIHRLSHLSKVAEGLEVGSEIEKGQVIGFSGNTGNSTGPHIDYRIKVDGEYVDPMSYHS